LTAASVDAAPIDAARPVAPPLRLGTKLAFGVGSAAESLALYTVTSFALIFYNQVLGVPAHLAGLAISASLVFDGITDPIIGSLSDRTRSRLGRRHPYMFRRPYRSLRASSRSSIRRWIDCRIRGFSSGSARRSFCCASR
jgi:MFS family permease